MTVLSAPLAARVAKLVGRLGSSHDGEVIATGRAIERVLKGEGHDLHDLARHLAAPPPPPQITYRDQPAEEPAGPKSYGDWRGTWRQGWEQSSLNSELARVRHCQRLDGGRLSAWERAFLGNLCLRFNQMLCLTPKQLAVLTSIETKLEARSC